MNAMLDKQREKKVDELFRAFETVTDGSYLYVCDVKYDYSRWSADAISRFDLPGEYMFHAGQLWERLLHPDDRESYSESIAAICRLNKETSVSVTFLPPFAFFSLMTFSLMSVTTTPASRSLSMATVELSATTSPCTLWP